MKMIKDVSSDSRELKFRRKLSKSAGLTSPLVNEQVIVNKVDGKTVCKFQFDMNRHNIIYQRPEGAYCSDMSRNLTPENRQRMQPWLESRINSQDIEGLQWMDKEQKIFKVPWKHVGNREWSERDGIIFREWAIHTGRFREGVDQPDWPTWKTRFRCALTKLPGIEELKHLNKLDGQTEEPFRVYKFVPKKSTVGEIHTFSPPYEQQYMDDSDSNSQHSVMDFTMANSQTMCLLRKPTCNAQDLNQQLIGQMTPSFTLLPTIKIENHMQGVPTIPTTVMAETDMDITDRLPSDIQSMDSNDLIKLDSAEMRNLSLESGGESFKMRAENIDFIEEIAKKHLPGQNNNPPTLVEIMNSATLDTNDKKLLVTIKYLLVPVHEELCTNPNGFRMFFAKNVNINQGEFEHFFGSVDAKQISLPISDLPNPAQQKLTLEILSSTDRGVIIKVKNGNIYATRKCRCRIYVSRPTLDNNYEILRLERDVETLVFDLLKYFKPAMERYLFDKGPKPCTNVMVGFGQNFTMVQESLDNLLVSANVVHAEARNLLSKIIYSSPHSPEIEQSDSTPTDQLLDVLQYTQQQ